MFNGYLDFFFVKLPVQIFCLFYFIFLFGCLSSYQFILVHEIF